MLKTNSTWGSIAYMASH